MKALHSTQFFTPSSSAPDSRPPCGCIRRPPNANSIRTGQYATLGCSERRKRSERPVLHRLVPVRKHENEIEFFFRTRPPTATDAGPPHFASGRLDSDASSQGLIQHPLDQK